MGGGVQDHLFGIVVGHVYYFFEDIRVFKIDLNGLEVCPTSYYTNIYSSREFEMAETAYEE